jgi:hypothetical protein
MTDTAPDTTISDALTLLDAGSVIFDKKWSKRLPIVGDVSVELKIISTANPSTFTFSITVQIANKTFNWSKDVSGNITIPVNLVDGFGLEVDVAGWSLSSRQLSFDLLVKITGPFGFSTTLFHQRVNIPLPTREEVEALASMDSTQLEQFALQESNLDRLIQPTLMAGQGGLVGAEFFSHTNDDNKDHDTGVYVEVKTNDLGIRLAHINNADSSGRDETEYNDHSNHTIPLIVDSSGATLAQCQGFKFRVGTVANGNDKWEFNGTVTLRFETENGEQTLSREIGDSTLNSRHSRQVWTGWAGN